MHRQSESIAQLAAALSKAQGEIKNPKKEAENPYFRSSYADLSSVIDSIKGPFSKYGLSFIQYIEKDPTTGTLLLYTQLMHESGEWSTSGGLEILSSKTEKGVEKRDMQTLGSAITYGRRYDLTSMAGIYQDDDDGNEASGLPVSNPIPKEWKMSAMQKEYVLALGSANGWPSSDITNYIKQKFNKMSWSSLTKNEYDQLYKYLEGNPKPLKE